MKLMEVYQNMAGIVSEITGLSYSEIINSNREECVDARSLLVNKLLKMGFSERRISDYSGLTIQCINKLKNGFDKRLLKYECSTIFKQINNEL